MKKTRKDDFTDFAGHPNESRAWIQVKPADATVELGELSTVGTLKAWVPPGKRRYTISRPGYVTETGTFDLPVGMYTVQFRLEREQGDRDPRLAKILALEGDDATLTLSAAQKKIYYRGSKRGAQPKDIGLCVFDFTRLDEDNDRDDDEEGDDDGGAEQALHDYFDLEVIEAKTRKNQLVPFAALDIIGSARFDGGLKEMINRGLLCWEPATGKVSWLIDKQLTPFAGSLAELRIAATRDAST